MSKYGNNHEKINYVEFPTRDLEITRRFFSGAFGWSFQDYGPEYTAFFGAGINGGFFQSEQCSSAAQGAALVVLYSENLEETQEHIRSAGGSIVKPIFSFPGGRRFHFTEPSGNELAVWTDLKPLSAI